MFFIGALIGGPLGIFLAMWWHGDLKLKGWCRR